VRLEQRREYIVAQAGLIQLLKAGCVSLSRPATALNGGFNRRHKKTALLGGKAAVVDGMVVVSE